MHERNVRHRDIKPSNILVKGDRVIFADFGSSRAFASEMNSMSEGTSIGHTKMYCAPEVVKETERGRSADIFSLGCVFSEMVTVMGGRTMDDYFKFRATERGDDRDTVRRETHNYHATLHLVEEWFEKAKSPSDYTTFIKPMLRFDRDKRPTAVEVAKEVREFYGDDAVHCDFCHSPSRL